MNPSSKILVTGASGFLGSRIVHRLAEYGFTDIRCLSRSSSGRKKLRAMNSTLPKKPLEIVEGNLVRRSDADAAAEGRDIIIHCAAGKGGPVAAMFQNTVVATRNLLESAIKNPRLKRIVHISSFSVYGTAQLKKHAELNENTPTEKHIHRRNDGYAYVKLKQENMFDSYASRFQLPIVVLRPGVIYGPGGDEISRRVGFRLSNYFLNIGGDNLLPLSYVDNCADAVTLAVIVPNIEGEVFNVLDDDLRTCSQFLAGYKRKVRPIRTIKISYPVFLMLSSFFEGYVRYSKEQLPLVFSRYKTAATWKRLRFSNKKLRETLGWSQSIPTDVGLERHYHHFSSVYANP